MNFIELDRSDPCHIQCQCIDYSVVQCSTNFTMASNLSTPTSDRYLDPPHKYIPYTRWTACPECSTNIIVGYKGYNEKV